MAAATNYESNLPKISALNFAISFLIVMPIIIPYWQSKGLSLKEIYQLQAIFGAVVVLLDLPAGYLSDILSRKACLVAVGFFYACGSMILGMGQTFWDFVAFEVVMAFALCLYSGSDVALIYDSLAASQNKAKAHSHFLGRRLFASQMGESIASLAGGMLAASALTLPAQVNMVTSWVPLLIALTLKEPPRQKMSSRTHKENWGEVLRFVRQSSPLLRSLIAMALLYGFASYLAVWIYQPYWKHIDIPLSWFGYLWMISNLLVAVVGRFASGMELRWGFKRIKWVILFAPALAYLGMALGTGWIGAAMLIFFSLSRGLNQVITISHINHLIPPQLRATLNSVVSMGVRALFFLVGPWLGGWLDREAFLPVCLGLGTIYFILALFLGRRLQGESLAHTR